MAVITVPDSVRTFLTNLSERVEFRDEAGNPLGLFTPQKVAEDVFGRNPRGKDVVSFRVEGGGAITVKISLKADILKFGSRMSESK